MDTRKSFKPALLSLAVAAAMTSGHVMAQQEESAKTDDSMVEVIAVTGIRGSLMRAQAVKQESTSIVEAISAEDIGKLPDSSIAESLARLPGLAGERVGGRTSGISVRGFKEDFVGTSLNGRELIGIGDNRGIEYDLYPSEIMTGATIHKSSNATLITQGLGGTVDLQTVRPLAASETLTVTGVYEAHQAPADNPDFDDKGYRYSLSFVEKFADDTIGLAVAIAHTTTPNNQRKYGVWGYNTNDAGQITPAGLDTNAQSTELKRDTVSAVLQYQPNDRLNIIADYLQIDFEDSGVLRGVIEPFAVGTVSGSGVNTTGTQIEANPVLRTDPLNKDGELTAFGVNVEYYLTDDWKVEVDLSRSESNKFEQRAESYAGLGRSGSLTNADFGTRNFEMSSEGVFFTGSNGLGAFSNPDELQLTGPQVWGGGLANLSDLFETSVLKANGEPFSYLNAQDGFNNFFTIEEELTQLKFEVEGLIDDSIVTKVTAGLHYSDRYKDKENNGFFATANVFPGSQSVSESGVPIAGLTDLTWAGLGYVVAYDSNAPYENGYYTQNNGGFLEPDRFGDTYVVEEEVTTIYAKADFEYELGDIVLFGNVGAQYVDTDQTSDGTLGVIGSNFRVCDTDSNSVIDESCSITDGASYSHFLPSLSINAEVVENQFVRFGASKTISRARLDQMKASGFVKFDLNDQFITIPNTRADVEQYGTPWSKSAGNAKLRPLESNNFDLSFESYFEDEGYVAISLFYKDLVNLTRQSNPLIDFTNDETNNGANYFVPGFHDRTLDVDFTNSATGEFFPAGTFVTPPDFGYFSFFEDGLEGSVQGAELTANLPLGMFADELEGFGVVASATFIDAEVDDGSSIPGQSDEIYSLVTYYENEGFEVRIAMTDRSGFTTYERAGSNKIGEADRDGTQVVDAQISYDFENSNIEALQGLRISLQGTNLLDDADQVSRDGNGIVTTRREFGPSYMLNFNYSFY
ncbi:TonB-dependent receptor [Glaciecola sp. MF2-115]|uniref:TonB-dependent receptor n=1 Tax=Glaciecola sp. MF2-115 TaxID=3384827 RepID=UPI0039A15E02